MNNLFSATIRLDADRFVRPLRTAKTEMGAFAATAKATESRFNSTSRTVANQTSFMGRMVQRGMMAGSAAASGFNRTLQWTDRRIMGLARTLKYSILFGGFGLSAVFTGGITAGIRFNATMEQNEIALKNFLGSTKAARKEMAILYDIAKTTPFELPDVTGVARKFLAFGFSVQQTNAYIRTLADAAASTGAGAESMQRIVLAIGQIQAKGRVQGDELLQLTEAGIPAYRILQQQLGLTKEEIGRIGELQISAAKAIPALMRGMNKLYAGSSAAQAKTFLGMWSTFKDSANQTLGAVTDGLFNASKGWLRSLVRFSDDTEKIWRGPGSIESKFSRTWKRLTGGLNDWLDGGGQQDIANASEKFGDMLAGAFNAAFGVGGGTGEQNPFYRAGSTAVRSFIKGFTGSLKGRDILGSPIARVIEGYLLLKFGPRFFRRIGRGGGGTGATGVGAGTITGVGRDLAVDKAIGQNVYWHTPMPVRIVGGGGPGGGGPVPGPGGTRGPGTPVPAPVPRTPGDRIPGGPLPYPTAPRRPSAWRRGVGRAGRGIKGLGTRLGVGSTAGISGAWYAAPAIMGWDWATTGNPFTTAIQIGELGGYGLRSLFGMDDRPQDSDAARRTGLHMDPRYTGHRLWSQQMRRRRNAQRRSARRAATRNNDLFQRPTLGSYGEINKPSRAATEGPLAGLLPTATLERRVQSENQRAAERTNKATESTVKKGKPNMQAAGKAQGLAIGLGFVDPAVLSKTRDSVQAIITAAQRTLSSNVSGLTGAAGGTTGGLGALKTWFTDNDAGTGDAPNSGMGGSTFYDVGKAMGMQFASSLSAGVRDGVNSGGVSGAPGGMPGGLGGNWGGAQPLALGLFRNAGLTVTPEMSQKRPTKNTASGGISDHWTGNTSAYAVDYPTVPPAGDALAQRLAALLGVPEYRGGYWLNRNIDGYRYQLGWRTPGHFDHIHAGVRKLHGGGTFYAPSAGGEGLALLRDRERVVPASGNRARDRVRHVRLDLNVSVSGTTGGADIDELAHQLGVRVAEAIDNMSLVAED